MSLYREAGSRRGRAAAVLALMLVVGGVLGFAVAWVLKPEPTLADRIEDLQADVRPALDVLEIVPLNYRSDDPPTKRAASDQLDAARDDLEAVRGDLAALDSAGAARLTATLDELTRLMEEGASPAQVDAAVRRLERQVRESARLDLD